MTNLTFTTIKRRETLKSKIYGYARVSTIHQSIERQVYNIEKQYPKIDRIYSEKYTGTKEKGRLEFQKLLKAAKEGDTIVFDSVSRMSRNSMEGIKTYFELVERGINLIFLKEPYINSDIYKMEKDRKIDLVGDEIADEYIKATNNVLHILAERQIKIAFDQAEKEVLDLRGRIKEGIEKAKREGESQIGNVKGVKLTTKKSKVAKEKILKHSKNFEGQMDDKDLIEFIRVSRNTFYKYKKELLKEKGLI